MLTFVMLPMLVLSSLVTPIDSLDCYLCIGIHNASECHTLITCPPDHMCSTESKEIQNNIIFDLTCKLSKDCNAVTTSPSSLVGQPQNTSCSQCCDQAGCNTNLCSAGNQRLNSTGGCKDDPAFNCAQISTAFNICADVSHAKSVCRNFCGLCDMVDGSWSNWGTWSACGVTCGNGTISRTRTCTNPSPSHGGLDCSGTSKQNSICHVQDCPIAGGWSAWSPWGSCSVTCGDGLRRRDRSCSNPYPQRYGDHCFGDDKVYETCFERSCADGGWSLWSSWDTCTATCNGGLQSRTRTCTNPAPSQFGRDCRGTDVDKQLCNSHNCPETDGGWSYWSSWGTCTATCNGGLQSRTRTCTNPAPSQFGRDCRGNDVDKQLCNTHNCHEKAVAFSVYYPSGTLVNQKPIFQMAVLNTGSYNMRTGVFTCPVAGIYSFSLTIMKYSSKSWMDCHYHVNGVTKTRVYASDETIDSSTSSQTMVTKLAVGNTVDVECRGWEHVGHGYETSFSGMLITPS